MITALVYLNDVEEGGHTSFGKLNIHVNPEKRKLLVFHNCYEGTTKRHENTLHAGTPPTKGEKYAFNLWFREKPRNIIVYDPDNEKVVEEKKGGSIEKKNIYTSKISEYHINNENKSVFKIKGLPAIYWLNLDADTHRREYMEEQFEYWQIETV